MYQTALKMGTSLSQKFSKISSFLLKTGTYNYTVHILIMDTPNKDHLYIEIWC